MFWAHDKFMWSIFTFMRIYFTSTKVLSINTKPQLNTTVNVTHAMYCIHRTRQCHWKINKICAHYGWIININILKTKNWKAESRIDMYHTYNTGGHTNIKISCSLGSQKQDQLCRISVNSPHAKPQQNTIEHEKRETKYNPLFSAYVITYLWL